jgi:hypothetical protein
MGCFVLLILFVILSFVAGASGVIGHTAVAAGFFWLAVARGTGVGWGLSFPWVTLPFPFLTVFRVARLGFGTYRDRDLSLFLCPFFCLFLERCFALS